MQYFQGFLAKLPVCPNPDNTVVPKCSGDEAPPGLERTVQFGDTESWQEPVLSLIMCQPGCDVRSVENSRSPRMSRMDVFVTALVRDSASGVQEIRYRTLSICCTSEMLSTSSIFSKIFTDPFTFAMPSR